MKKNILYVIFVLTLCVVAVLNVKIVQTENKSYDLSMVSIEAISNGGNGENGDGETVSDCDIFKYNREQAEGYKDVVITTEIKTNGGLFFAGRWVKIGAGVSIKGTVGIPECKDRKPNCCLKSHIEKSVKYY